MDDWLDCTDGKRHVYGRWLFATLGTILGLRLEYCWAAPCTTHPPQLLLFTRLLLLKVEQPSPQLAKKGWGWKGMISDEWVCWGLMVPLMPMLDLPPTEPEAYNCIIWALVDPRLDLPVIPPVLMSVKLSKSSEQEREFPLSWLVSVVTLARALWTLGAKLATDEDGLQATSLHHKPPAGLPSACSFSG